MSFMFFSLMCPQLLILFCAAVLGGTLNAVAGGGSFIGFPSLVFTGVLPIQANATNTIALWPGSVASVYAYRHELAQQKGNLLLLLVSTSLIGGTLGAILLVKTPREAFAHVIPYLLLLTTCLFAGSAPLTARLRFLSKKQAQWSTLELIGASIAQLAIAVYGGYFGGGIGILMLAVLSVMGMENIHMMNALKTLLTSCINGVAVITFLLAGMVAWPQATSMILGAILGGYSGAYWARKIEQKWVRLLVILIGFSMTLYFFMSQR